MRQISHISKTIALLMLVSVLALACAPQAPMDVMDEPAAVDDETMPMEDDSMPMEIEVTMTPSSFQPGQVTIAVGTAVTWVNTDSMVHTVTSGLRGSATGMFDQSLSPGQSYTYVFDEAGTFDYHCTLHPGMDGIVIVE